MVEGKLPERDEGSACAGCSSNGPEDCAHKCSIYDQCKAWSVKKNTNACWLFSTPANNVKKGDEGWVYGFPCKSSGKYFGLQIFLSKVFLRNYERYRSIRRCWGYLKGRF